MTDAKYFAFIQSASGGDPLAWAYLPTPAIAVVTACDREKLVENDGPLRLVAAPANVSATSLFVKNVVDLPEPEPGSPLAGVELERADFSVDPVNVAADDGGAELLKAVEASYPPPAGWLAAVLKQLATGELPMFPTGPSSGMTPDAIRIAICRLLPPCRKRAGLRPRPARR